MWAHMGSERSVGFGLVWTAHLANPAPCADAFKKAREGTHKKIDA